MKHTAWGIVVASGKAEKLSGGVETPFLYLNDRPVLAYSLAAFQQCQDIDGIVVVAPAERAEGVMSMIKMFGFSKIRKIVAGGDRRAAFMSDALAQVAQLDRMVDVVCVQDASQPLIAPELIAETIKVARRQGCGIAAVSLPGPVFADAKRNVAGAQAAEAGNGWMAVSPQAFQLEKLQAAYPPKVKGQTPTPYASDIEAAQALQMPLRLVPTPGPAIRISSTEDLAPVLALMKPFPL